MINAIQKAYYLRAMNPSDTSVLTSLAVEAGLDEKQFAQDLASTEVQQALDNDFSLRRQLGVRGFPSLVLMQAEQLTPVEIDYRSCQPMLAAIAQALGD